jgi:cell wall assembly regulator SMI1
MLDVKKIRRLLDELARVKNQELPSGATKEDLDAFTRNTGITIPEELKEWLAICNGTYLFGGGFCGVNTAEDLDIECILARRSEFCDKGWIPVAQDGCGNYYIVPTRSEFGEGFPVFFSDTYSNWYVPTYIVASSIGRFLEFALQEAID